MSDERSGQELRYLMIELVSFAFFLIAAALVLIAVFSKAYKNWKS